MTFIIFAAMKIWTLQDCAILDDLAEYGVAYCNRQSWLCNDYRFMYDWMARQMKVRIGEPPLAAIRYPLWGWAQYASRKSPKPPCGPSMLDSDKNKGVFIEAEIPDEEVLLSDFMLWCSVLNGWNIKENKELEKRIDRFVKEHGCGYDFNAYPDDIRAQIVGTWDRVFDFTIRDKYYGGQHKRNRAIQATFWQLKRDYVLKSQIIKR